MGNRGVLISKDSVPLFLRGVSVICPHFTDAFFLWFSSLILLALQQVRGRLHGVRGCTQVPVQNVFAFYHLVDP